MHSMTLPEGLQESQKLEQPLWTPSTKAELGGKDENISAEEGQSSLTTSRYGTPMTIGINANLRSSRQPDSATFPSRWH